MALATGENKDYLIRYRLRPSLEIQRGSCDINYVIYFTYIYKKDKKIDNFTSIAFQPQGTQLFGIDSKFKVYGK